MTGIHLRVELQAEGLAVANGLVWKVGTRGQAGGAGGQVEALAMPLVHGDGVRQEGRAAAVASQGIVADLVQALFVRYDTGTHGARHQLSAQAEAEIGFAAGQPILDVA